MGQDKRQLSKVELYRENNKTKEKNQYYPKNPIPIEN